tara:strand:+ start:7714 stop:8652 length:939 start_codon:yes stop_codon:yes gene_type:complete
MVAPNPYQFINKGNPSTGMGQFQYYNGSFKQAIASSAAGNVGSPFTNVVIGGLKDYQNTSNYGTDSRVKLIDNDGNTTSGYISLKMASGWSGLFYVKTSNADFFDDNTIDETKRGGWNDDASFSNNLDAAKRNLDDQWPSIWVYEQGFGNLNDSRTVFGLDSGDYMSFDIDSESGNAAQARIRIDGVDYLNNEEADDDIWITCVWLRKWNPDIPSPNPLLDPVLDVCPLGQIPNELGVCIPDPDYVPPGPEPDVCPLGQIPNEFGICIPDPDYVPPEPEPEDEPEDDVSAFAMLALLVGIGVIVMTALKVRA